MAATQRFSKLAKEFGAPYVTTLWGEPKGNPEFARAIKENRIVTIFSANAGSHKDYGQIGFHPGSNVSYLVFPRKLPKGDPARIVGIDYNALAPEPARGKAVKPLKSVPPARKPDSRAPLAKAPKLQILPRPKKEKPIPSRPERPEKPFFATLRRTAVWEQRISVTAANQKEAKAKLEAAAREAVFDPTAARVETGIKSIRSPVGKKIQASLRSDAK